MNVNYNKHVCYNVALFYFLDIILLPGAYIRCLPGGDCMSLEGVDFPDIPVVSK